MFDPAYCEPMWRAITVAHPGWRTADIAATSGVGIDQVQMYVDWLVEVGLVRAHGPEKFITTPRAQKVRYAPRSDGTMGIGVTVLLNGRGEVFLLSESWPGAWERLLKALRPAGRPKKTASMLFIPSTRPGTKRDRMYQAMRDRGEWTYDDIAAATDSPRESVRRYTQRLKQAGYAKQVRINETYQAVYILTDQAGVERPPTPAGGIRNG